MSQGWGMGIPMCPGGGTSPISSGVRLELSIITPTPTFAAFCRDAADMSQSRHDDHPEIRSLGAVRTLKWSISPETRKENVGAKRCSRYADTLPVESSCARKDAMRSS